MRKIASLALLAFVAVGVWGPRFTTGVTRFSGEQRQFAEDAVRLARMVLDHPIERGLTRGMRVTDMMPLPPGTVDPITKAPCYWVAKVRAYSFFWVPLRTYAVWCRGASVWEHSDHPSPLLSADSNQFVERLSKQGVEVEEVARSKWESFFPGGAHKAAWMRTNLGILDVIFFPEAEDADKIRITQIESDPGRYRYRVEIDGWSSVIDSNAPELFTTRGNVFVVTRDAALDAAVKRALKQEWYRLLHPIRRHAAPLRSRLPSDGIPDLTAPPVTLPLTTWISSPARS
ncbi:hypothetical protein [Caldinitratiruptor microaerophilus]|uniref:Uncharacterized protein n=1 Tax=Caldinitratiruptor microaerophilus TaxID=671077 RepID=A0AA35G713_9FIRM|nr:hypothetical protein [Caldinitratiruptor microaerophilus]BDG62146.1 hypothetical protein caldi_32360 [Caldinitratiruptor microaerophilus]